MVTAFARYALECRAVEVVKVLESGRLCLTLEGSHTLPLEVLSILYGCWVDAHLLRQGLGAHLPKHWLGAHYLLWRIMRDCLPGLARCCSTLVEGRGRGKGGGSRPFQLSL